MATAMSELNDRIDDVARQMTKAAPPDGFRRRVLAQIEEKDARRSAFGVRRSSFSVRRAAFVLTPIAVAAAIVIAVSVSREGRKARTGNPAVQHQAAAAQAAEERAPQQSALRTAPHQIAPRTAVGAVAPRTVERTATPRTLAPRTVAPRTSLRDEPAPNNVASIAVAPLVLDTQPPESIQLERLDPIAPIIVAPLDINDTPRRNP
jgi:hypothetical protein